jgi:hypothetical protein
MKTENLGLQTAWVRKLEADNAKTETRSEFISHCRLLGELAAMKSGEP